MTLHYVSLFSGIEAFSVAASRCQEADFKPVFFSEIDPFPCAVLAHHYPNTPNLGDICKIRIDHDTNTATNGTTTVALPRTGIDILAGGSPCQDVSVAGRRAGMSEGSGTRSALAFEYARLVEELRPKVILWENVPGVLSSNGGLDFAAFLDSLVKRGYGLAWRVLDAQYVRVDGFPRAIPQRRKRVWLVGCLGADERTAAQILFERQGLCGDSAPRREAGKGFACPAGYISSGDAGLVGGARAAGTARADGSAAADGRGAGADGTGDVGGGRGNNAGGDSASGGCGEVAAPLCAADGKGKNGMDICGKCAVVPAPCNSNGGQVMPPLTADEFKMGQAQKDKGGGYILAAFDMTHADEVVREVGGDCAPTMQSRMGTDGNQVPLAVGFNVCTSPRFPDGGAKVEAAGTLAVDHREGCATMLKVRCGKDTYTKPDGSTGTAGKGALASEESAFTLSATQDQSLVLRHIVRRLTPVECERLQGFPDNYTRIPYRNKPAEECPDSPRYKALGNSWATNCAEWILRRICAAFRLGMI